MKNLQNFGVSEMSNKEMEKTEGGFVFLAITGLYIAAVGLGLTAFSVGWMVGSALADKANRES